MRLSVTVVLCLLGCGPPITGDEANVLSPSEVNDTIARANAGDLAAANTLAVYYGGIGDDDESRRWLSFAAQRGDCNAINVLFDDETSNETVDERAIAVLRSWAADHDCTITEP